jgi:polycomb protein EED
MMLGHGGDINYLCMHPTDPNLLLTCSKDESLRLWNLKTGVCCAIYGGLKGHNGDVLHCAFNHDGTEFASCGMDSCKE